MSQEQGDTRKKIQEIALKLFTDQGYDKTSLREIAEQLGVTKAALYYHFKSKEEIVGSVVENVSATVQEFVDWAFGQPRTLEARREILRRLSALMRTTWQPLVRFAQANQSQMGRFPQGEESLDRVRQVFSLLRDPDADPVAAFRSMLAGMALLMATAPASFFVNLGGDTHDVALEVALDLISR